MTRLLLDAAEEWRPVAQLDGMYEVSNRGRVRRAPRVVEGSDGKSYRLDAYLISWSYSGRDARQISVQVTYPKAQRRNIPVKRLVFDAFCGIARKGAVIGFRDGNDHNITPENLFLKANQ